MTSESPSLPAAPAPVAAAAGPAHAAPEPAVETAPAASTDSTASTDQPPAEPEAPPAPAWPHRHIDFRGDRLEIRKPRRAAVAALQVTLTSSFTQETQNENIARFLSNHLSAASFARVNDRMIDPDDSDYGDGDYLDLIVAMIEAPDIPAEPAAEAPPAG